LPAHDEFRPEVLASSRRLLGEGSRVLDTAANPPKENQMKTYPTEAEISKVMEERKLNRIGAVQFLRRQSAKAAPAVVTQAETVLTAAMSSEKQIHKAARKPKAAKPKAAKKTRKVVELPKKSSEQVKVDRAVLDDVIRKALKQGYGRPIPILGVLGQRFAVPSQSQGFPFYRVLADAGKDGFVAVFVSGFYPGGPGPKASISPAVKSSYTVSRLLKSIEKRTKRAADKLGREVKAAKESK